MCKKYIFVCIIFLFILNLKFINGQDDKTCFRNVHERCLYEQDYTREELNIAVKWLREQFADTDPIRPPCKHIWVRKEAKCYTRNEWEEYAEAYRELNRRGILKRLVKVHDEYWAAAHKFTEGILWHIWLNNLFQKELFKINPKVVFPYWDFYIDSFRPEKSSIWKYLGHSGNQHNDYAVTDGLFANLTLFYPNNHILRRQWNPDGTVSPWESPEWATSVLQSTPYQRNLIRPQLDLLAKYSQIETVRNSVRKIVGGVLSLYFQIYSIFVIQISYVAHFKTHLHLGGWAGDLSISIAPNDPVFWMFHEMIYITQYKWQLTNRRNLVPRSYDLGVAIDWRSSDITLSNIEADSLTYFKNVTVKELFQLTYGEMCYIPEQFIRSIIDIITGKRRVPTAFERLKSSLLPHLFLKWFPKFDLNPEGFTDFDHLLPEIGDCNRNCKPLPVAIDFQATKNGRRQYSRFQKDKGIDLTPLLDPIEVNYKRFMADLQNSNYCSPYAY